MDGFWMFPTAVTITASPQFRSHVALLWWWCHHPHHHFFWANKINSLNVLLWLWWYPCFCSHHSLVLLNVPPTALSDLLHITSDSLSTLRAATAKMVKMRLESKILFNIRWHITSCPVVWNGIHFLSPKLGWQPLPCISFLVLKCCERCVMKDETKLDDTKRYKTLQYNKVVL